LKENIDRIGANLYEIQHGQQLLDKNGLLVCFVEEDTIFSFGNDSFLLLEISEVF